MDARGEDAVEREWRDRNRTSFSLGLPSPMFCSESWAMSSLYSRFRLEMVSLFCFMVHCDVSKYALRSPSVVREGENRGG